MRILPSLVALLALTAHAFAQQPAKPASSAVAPWGRVVCMGASVTAGFTALEPFGGTNTARLRLHHYVDAALLAPHEPVQNLAHSMFFLLPEAQGQRQITEALEAQPTLVLAVDFLFWFCYGKSAAEEDRLQRFERGLRLLEQIKCPIVLGDLPDASGASHEMLPIAFIPSARTRDRANLRLKEWAAAHTNVVLLPLSKIMRAVTTGEGLTVRGQSTPKNGVASLLQDDRLHTTPTGCAWLALAALEAFQATRAESTAQEIRWKPDEVLRLALNAARARPPAQN